MVQFVSGIHSQSDIAGDSGSQFGLGDTLQSVFFVPNKSPADSWLVGVGGAFLLSTATDELLGGEKWGAGPTAMALRQTGPWTYGGLANHIWSFAGDDDRQDVNQTFLQPFISYTTPEAWQYSFTTETVFKWETEDWTVHLNVTVGKTVNIGGRPVSFAGGVRYWAAARTDLGFVS